MRKPRERISFQTYLIDLNRRDDVFINELRHVYEAFEALDIDYIQGILIAVKSAEKASQEAQRAQKDVDVTVDRLGQTYKSFNQFKDNINSIKHIKDIDTIWKEHQEITKEIEQLKKRYRGSTLISALSLLTVCADIILHIIGVL